MIRRSFSLFAGFIIAMILGSLNPAVSASIAGSSCTKLNSIKTVSNVKYTCTKSGKKLVWNKGVAIQIKTTPVPTLPNSPLPTPTPAPSKSVEPAPSAKPIPVFTPPSAPTNWNDLIQNASGISYWAWKKSSDKISATNSKLGNIEVVIGPTSIPDNPTPLVGLNLISRLVGNFEEPKKVLLVYAGEKDIEWGQLQIDQFCGQNACGYDVKGEAKKACNVPITPCWGGVAMRNQQTNVPMIYATASDWGKTDANHTQGTLEAHEYFHNVQQTLLAEAGTGRVPRWLIEGGATWAAAAAVFNSDFDKYLVERQKNSNDTLVRIKPTEAWLEKFLDPNYQTGWDIWNDNTYDHWNVYDIGSLASEILVALNGTDTYMNLYKLVGSGKTYAQAFEELYGIPWSNAAKLIAKAIVAEQK